MYPIQPPETDDYEQVLRTCAEGFSYASTQDKRNRILNSVEDILTAGEQYHMLANDGHLSDFLEHAHCGVATKSDLNSLYVEKFVPSGSPGREKYLMLKGLAHRKTCPICGHRTVSTLDHYLPKAKYPSLSLYFRNLVPSCLNCNTEKLANSNTLTIHPYYEDVTNFLWLKCEIKETDPVGVSYSVIENIDDETMRVRLAAQLSELKIDELYENQALNRLSDSRYQFIELFRRGGRAALKRHIDDVLVSMQMRRLNSWGAALFRGLAGSEWFLNGGVQYISD